MHADPLAEIRRAAAYVDRDVIDLAGTDAHQLALGLHYQLQQAQGKLVRVSAGEVYDVAVDMRRSSADFGKWVGVHLSAENKRQMWIPEGFAHGFLVLSEYAECLYKTTDYYAPTHERCIRWDDAQLAIDWPLDGLSPQLSAKDQQGLSLTEAETFP